MNHVIYKYPFVINNEVILDMPSLARILTVQVQKGTPCLWALINPAAEFQKRVLRIYGTGHDIPESLTNLTYISSIQLASETLIFHVFDAGEFIGD